MYRMCLLNLNKIKNWKLFIKIVSDSNHPLHQLLIPKNQLIFPTRTYKKPWINLAKPFPLIISARSPFKLLILISLLTINHHLSNLVKTPLSLRKSPTTKPQLLLFLPIIFQLIYLEVDLNPLEILLISDLIHRPLWPLPLVIRLVLNKWISIISNLTWTICLNFSTSSKRIKINSDRLIWLLWLKPLRPILISYKNSTHCNQLKIQPLWLLEKLFLKPLMELPFKTLQLLLLNWMPMTVDWSNRICRISIMPFWTMTRINSIKLSTVYNNSEINEK